jgi:hypothetical protein
MVTFWFTIYSTRYFSHPMQWQIPGVMELKNDACFKYNKNKATQICIP